MASKLGTLLTVGKPLPNPDVAIMENGTRKSAKLVNVVARNSIINCVPAAFTKVCTQSHLASYKDKKMGDYKVYFISTDKIPSLEIWKAQEKAENVIMISDMNVAFGMASGLGEISPSALGYVLRRSTIIVENGVISKVIVEDDNAKCEFTKADAVVKELKCKEEGKEEPKK